MCPIYEYECPKCGKFDFYHKTFKEGKLDNCPKCKSKVKKLISGNIKFTFKGYGFYTTDYGKDRPPPPSSTSRRQLNKKRKKLRDEGFQGKFHQTS